MNEKFVMHLAAKPFGQIVSGEKTVEVRLYDEKRRLISEGDEIEFVCGNEKVCGRVVSLSRFDSFRALAASPLAARCGFSDLRASAVEKEMRKYYSVSDELLYGVPAIGVEVEAANEK